MSLIGSSQMAKTGTSEPKVVILLTTYRDPPLLNEILKSIKHTKYSNFEIITIDCSSRNVRKALEDASFKVPLTYVGLERDKGAAHQLNKGFQIALRDKTAEYIVRIEGDAIPLDPDWLRILVDVMERYSQVAIAMPFDTNRKQRIECGGKLYGNCTFSPIQECPLTICQCIGTGGHCFITRRAYVEELFQEGIKPYWTPFFISSEDIDFNLKAYLRGYKVVTVGSTRVLHEGTSMPKNRSFRAPYRVFHMYKNRLCLMFFNFSLKHIAVNIWYRILQDLGSALLYSELVLMLKGYSWVLTNLGHVIQHRNLRMVRWRRVTEKELKRDVLIRLPMPIRMPE